MSPLAPAIQQLRRRRCWIFDLDGTLTVAVHDFPRIRSELGLPSDCDIIDHLNGLPLAQALPLWNRLVELERGLVAQTQPAHGVEPLLEFLWRRGDRLGVLTRNSQVNAWSCLEILGIARFFRADAVLGRDEAAPKPDPEGIERLLALWQAEAGAGVMVGDYRYDLLAGRQAGVMTVHVDEGGEFPWPDAMDHGVVNLAQLHQQLA